MWVEPLEASGLAWETEGEYEMGCLFHRNFTDACWNDPRCISGPVASVGSDSSFVFDFGRAADGRGDILPRHRGLPNQISSLPPNSQRARSLARWTCSRP